MPRFLGMLPAIEPAEVICHGDIAPYNVVVKQQQIVGLIDFDSAFIGPKLWDVAYAAYRFCPLKHSNNPDNFNPIQQQIRRLKLFMQAYAVEASIDELLGVLIQRLQALVDFMQQRASLGEQHFIDNLNDGHHLQYLQDIEYIKNIIKHLEV